MRRVLRGAAVLIATAAQPPCSARRGLLRAVAGASLGAGGALRLPRMALCITAWHWVAAAAPALHVRGPRAWLTESTPSQRELQIV